MVPLSTFSIVAYDPNRKEWGVAVQSKFLAAGALVMWASASAGAIATQANANVSYGPLGLDMLSTGKTATEVIHLLTQTDEGQASRQIGAVDMFGGSAAYTGTECMAWAGHIIGDGFACQGNILIPGTIEAMAHKYEKIRGKNGELADWLVEILAEGQKAGGDKRGQQSAGILVVHEKGGYLGKTDRYIDLRVDDDTKPIEKLRTLIELHHLYFGEVDQNRLVELSTYATEIQELLLRTGYYAGSINGNFDELTRKSLRTLVGIENLEDRWNGEGDFIDSLVLDFLQNKYKD